MFLFVIVLLAVVALAFAAEESVNWKCTLSSKESPGGDDKIEACNTGGDGNVTTLHFTYADPKFDNDQKLGCALGPPKRCNLVQAKENGTDGESTWLYVGFYKKCNMMTVAPANGSESLNDGSCPFSFDDSVLFYDYVRWWNYENDDGDDMCLKVTCDVGDTCEPVAGGVAGEGGVGCGPPTPPSPSAAGQVGVGIGVVVVVVLATLML